MASSDFRPPMATGADAVTPAPEGRAAGAQEAGNQNDEGGSQMTLPLPGGPESMRAAETSEEEQRARSADDRTASMELYDRVGTSFGARLRAAREARGWSEADVGQRLRLPVRLIARLESDDYEGLTQGVFLRGYLGSYARLVGVPIEHANQVASVHSSVAPLVATGTISRSRYLFDRYSVSATYLVLTAIIVVPAVWLATHGGLEQNLARTTPLDPPAITAPARDTALASNADGGATGPAGAATGESAPERAPEPAPVIASMAPFPSAAPETPAPAPEAAKASPAAGTGVHVLELKLAQQSWVEILAGDGRKLEYGMLAAGSEHSYRSDGPLAVRIGNAQGAEVRTDGNLVDLAAYQRGNVAHVRVFDASGASRIDQ